MRLRFPSTILFGNGCLAELPRLLADLGLARPFVATDAGVAATGLADRLRRALAVAGCAVAGWDGIATNPDEEQPEICRDLMAAAGSDCVVALGGGSVIDAAKVAAALAVNGGRTADYFGFDRMSRRGLPLITVPTTPGSGAEVSSHAVIFGHAARRKEVVAGLQLLPAAALIDPELSATLPRNETTWTALDSLVHALEAFVARRASPATDAFALLAVPRIAAALPRVLAGGGAAAAERGIAEDAATAREALSQGCLYANLAMANTNAGVIHALGYPLTAAHGVPHGLANALMAPAALDHAWHALPDRYAELALLLGGRQAADLASRLRLLLAAAGVRDTLAGWGVVEAELPALAHAATHFRPVLDNTPWRAGESDLLAVYSAAFAAS